MPYYEVTITAKIEDKNAKAAMTDLILELESFANTPKQKLPSYIKVTAKEY
jgi:hypothetical protein